MPTEKRSARHTAPPYNGSGLICTKTALTVSAGAQQLDARMVSRVDWTALLGVIGKLLSDGENLQRKVLLDKVESIDVCCAEPVRQRLFYDISTQLGDIARLLEISSMLDPHSDSNANRGLPFACNRCNRNCFPAKEHAR